jgi:D-sedoheptulose 7-phosphate isomerase
MLEKHLEKLVLKYPVLKNTIDDINLSFITIKESLKNGGTLFLCGNGGSAADCEHIAGELLKSFLLPRKIDDLAFKSRIEEKFANDSNDISGKLQKGLRTISLTSHPALITAYSNDVDAEYIFAQQLYVMARPGDVLLAISTSGNAKNVYRALQVASGIGIKTILMTGISGGNGALISDCSIKVPLKETYEIQECHLPIYHTLCIMLEEYFYGKC